MSKSSTQWEKADVSYQNYIHYIKRKPEKFKLTLIDLYYIRNFKDGNASIHEKEKLANIKLKKYSEHLRVIHKEFSDKLQLVGPLLAGTFHRLSDNLTVLNQEDVEGLYESLSRNKELIDRLLK